jgi:hypothetical protein
MLKIKGRPGSDPIGNLIGKPISIFVFLVLILLSTSSGVPMTGKPAPAGGEAAWPQLAAKLTAEGAAWVDKTLAGLTLEKKIAQIGRAHV